MKKQFTTGEVSLNNYNNFKQGFVENSEIKRNQTYNENPTYNYNVNDSDIKNKEQSQSKTYDNIDIMESSSTHRSEKNPGIIQNAIVDDIQYENVNHSLNEEKVPIYIINLELEDKNSELKIYHNSDPEKLAYEFCSKNGLDFESMRYLVEQVNGLLTEYNSKENMVEETDVKIKQNKFDVIYELDQEENLGKAESKENMNDKSIDKNYDCFNKFKLDDSEIKKESIKNNLSSERMSYQIIDIDKAVESTRIVKEKQKSENSYLINSQDNQSKSISKDNFGMNDNFIDKVISNSNKITKIENSIAFTESLNEHNKEVYLKKQNNELNFNYGNNYNEIIKEIDKNELRNYTNLNDGGIKIEEYESSSKEKRPSTSISLKNQNTKLFPYEIEAKIDPKDKQLKHSRSKERMYLKTKREFNKDVFTHLYEDSKNTKMKKLLNENYQIQVVNNNYNFNISQFKDNFPVTKNSKKSQNSGVNLFEKGIKCKEKVNLKVHVFKNLKADEMKKICSFSPQIKPYKSSSGETINSNRIQNQDYKEYFIKKKEKIAEIQKNIINDDAENTFRPKINEKSKDVIPKVFNMDYTNFRRILTERNVNKIKAQKETFKPITSSKKNDEILVKSKNFSVSYKNNDPSEVASQENYRSSSNTLNEHIDDNYNNQAKSYYVSPNFDSRQEKYKELHKEKINQIKIYKDKQDKQKSESIFFIQNKHNQAILSNRQNYSNSNFDEENIFIKNYNYANIYKQNRDNIEHIGVEKLKKTFNIKKTDVQSSKLFENKKEKMFKKLFNTLDYDHDNNISKRSVGIGRLSKKLQNLISPLIKELIEEDETLNIEEFVEAMGHLNSCLTYNEKNELLKEISNIQTESSPNKGVKKLVKNSPASTFTATFFKPTHEQIMKNKSTVESHSNISYINSKKNESIKSPVSNFDPFVGFLSARMLTSERLKNKTNKNKSINNFSFKPQINQKSKKIDNKRFGEK